MKIIYYNLDLFKNNSYELIIIHELVDKFEVRAFSKDIMSFNQSKLVEYEKADDAKKMIIQIIDYITNNSQVSKVQLENSVKIQNSDIIIQMSDAKEVMLLNLEPYFEQVIESVMQKFSKNRNLMLCANNFTDFYLHKSSCSRFHIYDNKQISLYINFQNNNIIESELAFLDDFIKIFLSVNSHNVSLEEYFYYDENGVVYSSDYFRLKKGGIKIGFEGYFLNIIVRILEAQLSKNNQKLYRILVGGKNL